MRNGRIGNNTTSPGWCVAFAAMARQSGGGGCLFIIAIDDSDYTDLGGIAICLFEVWFLLLVSHVIVALGYYFRAGSGFINLLAASAFSSSADVVAFASYASQ